MRGSRLMSLRSHVPRGAPWHFRSRFGLYLIVLASVLATTWAPAVAQTLPPEFEATEVRFFAEGCGTVEGQAFVPTVHCGHVFHLRVDAVALQAGDLVANLTLVLGHVATGQTLGLGYLEHNVGVRVRGVPGTTVWLEAVVEPTSPCDVTARLQAGFARQPSAFDPFLVVSVVDAIVYSNGATLAEPESPTHAEFRPAPANEVGQARFGFSLQRSSCTIPETLRIFDAETTWGLKVKHTRPDAKVVRADVTGIHTEFLLRHSPGPVADVDVMHDSENLSGWANMDGTNVSFVKLPQRVLVRASMTGAELDWLLVYVTGGLPGGSLRAVRLDPAKISADVTVTDLERGRLMVNRISERVDIWDIDSVGPAQFHGSGSIQGSVWGYFSGRFFSVTLDARQLATWEQGFRWKEPLAAYVRHDGLADLSVLVRPTGTTASIVDLSITSLPHYASFTVVAGDDGEVDRVNATFTDGVNAQLIATGRMKKDGNDGRYEITLNRLASGSIELDVTNEDYEANLAFSSGLGYIDAYVDTEKDGRRIEIELTGRLLDYARLTHSSADEFTLGAMMGPKNGATMSAEVYVHTLVGVLDKQFTVWRQAGDAKYHLDFDIAGSRDVLVDAGKCQERQMGDHDVFLASTFNFAFACPA